MSRRISWLVLATTSTIVVSFVVPLCLLVRTLAEDRAMAEADQQAGSVAVLLAGLVDDAGLADVVATLDDGDGARTAVVTTDGTVVGGSPLLRQDPEVRRARRGEAFTVVDAAGGRVLLPVVTGDGTAVVRTEVPHEDLREGVTRAWVAIIGLGVALMAIAAIIAWQLGRRISEPLLGVAGVAHRLREGDLSARAEVAGTEETQELARALNGLADRTGELLVAERAAVADLSHRLRTPVTALRLDAEAVRDPELAERLGTHIGVLQRSIDAIVREARRPVRSDLAAECDATAVVAERVTFWRALAEDQGRDLTVELATEPHRVPVAADDLADLVDVLVDNVFAHTPEPAGFEVHYGVVGAEVQLRVADRGPGPTRAREVREGSTGLGLQIARRTATSAGGSLRISSGAGGGTVVTVLLPEVRH